MKRKAHLLKGIKGTEKKDNWLFFDTETKSIKKTKDMDRQSLKMGVAQHYRYDKKTALQSECIFYDNDTFGGYLESCTRKNSILNIMSMNLAFDFTICNLAQYLKFNGWELKTMMIESKVVILKYRKDKKSIIFLDLFNYVKASVSAIGELLGFPKLDVNFATVSDEDLLIYCRRDVEIIAKMMRHYMDFVVLNDLGCLGMTTPSQAFNAFRHRFMETDIFIHNFEGVSKLERRSYFGGRTECFHIGHIKSKVHVVDINSMYPDVMKRQKYPVKLHKTITNNAKLEDLKEWVKTHIVIADVMLNTDEPAYPIKRDDKTIFPVGQFKATLCQASIEYAIERNHITKVMFYAVYDSAYIFTNYIDFFYELRLKHKAANNTVYEQMDKLFLNSLYGKFGQRTRDIQPEGEWIRNETGIVEVFNESGIKIAKRIILAGESFLVYDKEEEGFNSFVAIASCVTDYARLYLWELKKKAGHDNVYYCDTDSLMLNSKGLKNLKNYMDEKTLGMLKLENTFKWLKIHGLKDYEGDTKKTLKGIKKNAKQLSENTYEQLQFPTMKGVIRSGMKAHIDIKTIRKTLSRVYTKGTISTNGKVSPFKLTEFC